MQAARIPAHQADAASPAQHHRGQSPPGRGPAGPGAHPPADQEFLARFGDAIDDRVAEIVDELLEERDSARRHRPGRCVSAASLIIAALAATAVLRYNPAAWTVWPSAAVISLAVARATSKRGGMTGA